MKYSKKGSLTADQKAELKFEYFKTQFKIIEKNYATFLDRRDSEAFFIRAENPDLNDQREHEYFKLF